MDSSSKQTWYSVRKGSDGGWDIWEKGVTFVGNFTTKKQAEEHLQTLKTGVQ